MTINLTDALPLCSKDATWKFEYADFIEYWWDRGEIIVIACWCPGDDSELEIRTIPRNELVDYMRDAIQNDWELVEGELLPGVEYKKTTETEDEEANENEDDF
jgi:hypothetical protein